MSEHGPQVFSNDERLQAIGQLRREIDSSGYALKASKRRFALLNTSL
jgi:hypothetical protein